jgi:predicted enzyme related to lactoylglutathione lyase
MENRDSAINWFEIPVVTGGTAVVLDKQEISPEIGYFTIMVDSESNRIYLHSMN